MAAGETPFLDCLQDYHLDDTIHFPPDYKERMLDVEAEVGLVNFNVMMILFLEDIQLPLGMIITS